MSQGSANYPWKYINDPIHGHIKLDRFLFQQIIDTPQFQRLRSLKQLGCAYFVFPGASHNRFEHSIGVSHLTGQLIEKFQQSQAELEITEREVRCLKMAGLCHDLGHGPFSHVFDNEFIRTARPEIKWSHEQASEMMLDYLIDENGVDLPQEDITFIKELIQGVPHSTVLNEKRKFLFEIVANKRNSVDVDKFDYISRDCHHVGIKSSYDFSRLMNFNRVINGEICFHAKEAFNIYEMFHTRYSLFKRIYTHRVGKAIEFMVTDAFLSADPVLKISESIFKPEEYQFLDDSILQVISKSKDPELETARKLIHQIQTRDLYKFVDEIMVQKSVLKHFSKAQVKVQDIISHQPDGADIEEQDIIIDWMKINYALQDKNPVDNIRFFSRYNDCEASTISKDRVSVTIPNEFEENTLRIFARDSTKAQDIQRAFRKWVAKGPLSQLAKITDSPITPNPMHTLPPDYMSPPRDNSSPTAHQQQKRKRLDY